VGIPFTMGFRPQLLVVSGLSVRIPLTMGFRPQLVVVSGLSVGIPLTVGFRPQLVVVSGLSVGIPLTVGFRLSRSLWLSQSPFANSFSFLMEFWLSRSLSRTFLSHDGILAITKPIHKFFFLTMESRLSRSLFHEFFFLTMESSAITEPFHEFSF
jgi:hypothetical protein